MGINHYFDYKTKCPHCGEGEILEHLHMGKSSAGWFYIVRTWPALEIFTLEDWLSFIHKHPDGFISDEYGKTIGLTSWLNIVMSRSRKYVQNENLFMDESTKYNIQYNLYYNKYLRSGVGPWSYDSKEFS